MDRQVIGFWFVVVAIFVACFGIAFAVAPESNIGFADAASVIAFASLMAVGIERITEFAWLLLDATGRFGGYFPLNVLMKQFKEVDTRTDEILGRLFDDTTKVLKDVIEVGNRSADELATIQSKLDELEVQRANLKVRLDQVRALSPGSGRLGSTAAIADQLSASMHTALGGLGVAGVATQQSIVTVRASAQTALEVIGALGDNPSRRIASLLFSSSLGMLAAGLIGVNLFVAALGELEAGAPELILYGPLGVVITGIVVGLGSGPTHEVVKGLQRYKESRGRMSIADLATSGTSTGAADTAAVAGPAAPIAGSQMLIRSTH